MEIDLCDMIKTLFAFSGAFFLIITCIFGYIVQPKYIIKKYSIETDLLTTKYFQHSMMSFAHKYYGGKRSIALTYTFHLFVAMMISDKFLSKLGGYRDIKDKNDILKHFSKKEKAYTLITGMSVIFAFIFAAGAVFMDYFVCS